MPMSLLALLPQHVPAYAVAMAFAVTLVLGLVAAEEAELRRRS